MAATDPRTEAVPGPGLTGMAGPPLGRRIAALALPALGMLG